MKFYFSSIMVITFLFLSGCEVDDIQMDIMQVDDPELESIEDVDKQENWTEGVVTYVIDGDTFTVQIEGGEEERVRPILVDAPEICHQSSPDDCEPEPYGEEASSFAEDILLNQTVYLELDESETDQYGRTLAYVYLENGDMFQELLLAEGLAEIAVFPPDVKYQERLEVIESEAKESGLGIWSQ